MRMMATISGNVVGKTKHYFGMPASLTPDLGSQQMGPPLFLVAEEKPDGFFLNRYGSEGVFVGDTWHRSIEEAKEQASYEYGDSVGSWQEIPPEIGDVVSYGLSIAKA